MSRFIYADHAGTTALSQTALAAMTPYFTEQYGNPSSLYRFGQEAKADLERARADIAACIGAKPEEIFFTSGGTTMAIFLTTIGLLVSVSRRPAAIRERVAPPALVRLKERWARAEG